MYTVVESEVIDDVREDLSLEDRKKVQGVKSGLRKDPYSELYGGTTQKDGSWQISIPIGVRRILVGYDIDEDRRLVILNYVKWERFREALDFVIGLFEADPGKRK
jgi:hypothetical protein